MIMILPSLWQIGKRREIEDRLLDQIKQTSDEFKQAEGIEDQGDDFAPSSRASRKNQVYELLGVSRA